MITVIADGTINISFVVWKLLSPILLKKVENHEESAEQIQPSV